MAPDRAGGAADRQLPEDLVEDEGSLPDLLELYRRLELLGVRWCVLEASSAPATGGGSLRLLVDVDDFRRAAGAVRATGGVAMPRRWPGDEALWVLRAPSGTMVVLRVRTTLPSRDGWGTRRRLARWVLTNRVPGPPPLLDPADRFWLVLRDTLPRGTPAGTSQEHVAELAKHPRVLDSPLTRLAVDAFPAGWRAERLVDAVRVGRPLPRIRRSTELRDRLYYARRRITAAASRVRHRWEHTLLISFVSSRPAPRTALLPPPTAWPLTTGAEPEARWSLSEELRVVRHRPLRLRAPDGIVCLRPHTRDSTSSELDRLNRRPSEETTGAASPVFVLAPGRRTETVEAEFSSWLWGLLRQRLLRAELRAALRSRST